VSFRVKVYKPFNDSASGLKFNNLHSADCHTKITLKNFCPVCNVDVPYTDMVKGHEYAPGKFAVFTPDEIKTCGDDTSVDLSIESFVPCESIPAIQFEGTMNFLSPEGKGDFRSFATLQQAMTGVYGIGRLVTRGGHDHLVAIKAEGKLLLMYRLRPFVTLRNIMDVPQYDAISSEVNPTELSLAKQLVELSTKQFDPKDAVSERTDRLQTLLTFKITGKPVDEPVEAKPAESVNDLMAALRASLAKAA